MGLKYHTIIVIPHTRARFRKLRLTNRQLVGAAAGLLLLTLGSIFISWSFLTNSVDRSELARIRRENQSIRKVNEAFEATVHNLEKQLGEYEERTRQLAIVAGIDNLAAGGGEAGIGGATFDGADASASGFLTSLETRSDRLAGDLDRVEQSLGERLQRISATPAIAPAKGVLTSGFGGRQDPLTGEPGPHPGIDIASYPGSPVVAPADGIVTLAGHNGGLGNAVYLSHGFGVATRFGHLARIAVKPGQRVHRGDTLGFVGSTGRSTGYHLHYEVRVDGSPVNPLGYILDPPARRF